MKRFRIYCVGVGLACLLAGCNIFEQRNPDLIINIEDDIVLSLWEELLPEQSLLSLQLTTLDTMQCSDVIFDHVSKQLGQDIEVLIKGLIQPQVCDLIPAPAHSDIDFMLEEGQYQFQLQIGSEIINDGILHVNPDYFRLEMLSSHGLQIGTTELKRVPQRAIWGYIALDEPNNDLSSSFLNTLLNIAQPMSLVSGEYGYFNVDPDTEQLLIKNEPAEKYLTRFIYRLDSSLQDLQMKIEDFRQEFGEQAQIAVFTWQGGTY